MGKKTFNVDFPWDGGLNRWGKRVGKDGESLRNLPRAPPPRPRCSCFSPGGSDHGVSTVLIRWNKKGCNPQSDQRPWLTCHTPLPLSSCTNLSEGKLTDPASRAGRGGGEVEVEGGDGGGPGDPVWVYDRGMGGWTEERTERLSFNSQFILLDSPQRTIACRMSLQYGHSVSQSLTHDCSM